MGSTYPAQTNFLGGEVSARMLSRLDYAGYSRSVLRMRNFMPRLQGPAVRNPSTTFFKDVSADGLVGRCIPFFTVDQRRSLVILQDESVSLITGFNEPDAPASGGGLLPQLQIVGNSDFDRVAGQSGIWDFEPTAFTGGEGDTLGCRYITTEFNGVLRCICRNWKYPELDNDTFEVTQTINVSEPNDSITFDYRILYESNPGSDGSEYTFLLTVGTTPGGNDVLAETITGPVGTVIERVESRSLPNPGFTGDLYVRFFCRAIDFGSTPIFDLDRFAAFIDGPELPEEPPISIDPAAVLYAEEDLELIQYVQSPYDDKPLVLVHPEYQPQWLFYDVNAGEYVFEPIPFVDAPTVWAAGNYPRACTSYQGRLMLGGTRKESETIWGSRPGDWANFSTDSYNEDDPPIPDKPVIVTPDSALEFTVTFRSPIQWMYGQKDFLVGAQNFEYQVTSESGLLQPSDIDVRLHTTHGSIPVQPESFGKYVAFPAERGTRVRQMKRVREDTGWVAPDLSMLADSILATGIRRMARMRNPHQMLVCLLSSGNLALLHEDEEAEIRGWSTMSFTGDVVDICVSPLSDGTDALVCLVSHNINGVRKLYIEAVFNWTYDRQWRYLSASTSYRFDTPTNVITGLEYLEGKRVQVIGDRQYLGSYLVTGGQVVLTDGNGLPYTFSAAVVGLGVDSELQLLPPVTPEVYGNISATKRYSYIVVRCLASSRPIINGQRPAARDPATPMGAPQLPDLLRDNKITNLGSDPYQFITIEENVPYPTEVQSVSGKLTSDNL